MIAECDSEYSSADYYLALPGTTPQSQTFYQNVKIVDMPMIFRAAKTPKDEVLQSLGLPIGIVSKIVVLGFGGFKRSEEWKLASEFLPEGWICIVLGEEGSNELPERFIGVSMNSYIPDYVNIADAVIGNIGYGTVSECIGHHTPLIYIPKEYWPEEKYLIDLLNRFDSGIRMSETDFVAGSWRHYLETASARKTNWSKHTLSSEEAIEIVVKEIEGII